ncbi:MAG: methyl-accepting chemotaxis protein [Microcoleus sp. PH2017_10_PVI_O_A]|nr:methyl-accepting chemotaxis protein [Microcoleus sp. PH2017_10_PVI_O_A]MCC3458353.1 methyl-accepting chemotaxis protein [Microcoleus sp. PH2017_11_PCY_U_A]MCC3478424.1 methyl-accepting chemotaxis protein [Microcoleus sp. PH2017_12_PCY_D_A]MCC3529023.1 methyl-accepting chemotaxis protein [Microcoleus sp. PH2017_21_RUC_O_A]MCC3541169.1 methyl-accepting chemotaxis protein [Microcoleus sp. PH2017_22_RUC_O_B]MCC3557815.1 methyl-accepting chemotaxis protein [Microcoleus sp. PH2017_27_LUM_O_A]TAE
MLKLLKLVPMYLRVLIILLVFLPALFAGLQRISLYGNLVQKTKEVRLLLKDNKAGSKPRIVEDLESRFKAASQYLEEVNSAALIDGIYGEQKIVFLGRQFGYDAIDYFCRILPNLLISFGLLGTFLGITLNLSNLSQTITQLQGNTNINQDLVFAELQKPLQGMGIAFITSLIAVFCSSALTVVNFLWNTGLAKSQLISYLEDYLDNVYQPKIQGQTRLDKVVKGMADTFDNFLTRFGQTVREGVESALKEKIEEIIKANLKAANLAEQVYGRLAEASGTIARGAHEFQEAARRFTEATNTLENSDFPEKLSIATANLATTQINFSNSTSSLADTVESLGITLSQIQDFSKQLVNVTEEISLLNQSSVQVLGLHQTNQQSLSQIIPKLQQGSQSFESAVTTLDKLQKRIVVRVDSLDKVQVELTKLVQTINNYTNQVNLGIDSMTGGITKTISHQTENNNLQSQAIVASINSFAGSIAETMNNQADSNRQQSEAIAESIEQYVHHLSDIKSELAELVETLREKIESPVVDKHLSDQNSWG